jgi:uncharacterized protein DUF2510
MATATEQTRAFQGSYESVFNAVATAAQANGWTISAADPSAGSLLVSAGMSMLSWGEYGEIRVAPAEPGVVMVGVKFKLKFGLVDWGKTKKNVDRLFASIDQVLASGGGGHAVGPMPGAAPAPGWYPDPHQRHQSRYWDGTVWTEHVADNGTTGADPV